MANPEFQNIFTVEGMWFKIIQIIRDRISRARSVGYLSAFDIRLPRSFLICLAITLLSYQTVDLFYNIISLSLAGEISGVGNNVAPVAVKSKKGLLEDFGIIVERNLFQTTVKAVQDSNSNLEPFAFDNQTANFDLKGTVVGDSSFGYIFVEEHNGKKQKLYRLGDVNRHAIMTHQ